LEEVWGKATPKTGGWGETPEAVRFYYLTANVACNFAYSL